MKIFEEFKEYNRLLIVGVVAGIVSGIFFSVYNDLRSQTENIYLLLGGSLITTIVWYFIILVISFMIYLILRKIK